VDKRPKNSDPEPLELIEEMVNLMESRGLVELEIEHQGMRLRLKKATAAGSAAPVVEYVPQPAPSAAKPAAPKPAEPERRLTIKSPMVGTFYRAPAPDAPAFVEIGQDVEVGQVVCILEAMKLMNEIKSELAGRVAEILIENGSPVEFGQPLFILEPRA